MKTKFYKVYIITNLKNKMSYVGCTSTSLRLRLYKHINNKTGCSELRSAINEFGKENFNIKEICRTDDKVEAKSLEGFYIIQNNCLYPNGYNLYLETKDTRIACQKIKDNACERLFGKKHKNSKYRGIKKNGKFFRCSFMKNGIVTTTKFKFKTKELAAQCYDLFMLSMNNKHLLNFPDNYDFYQDFTPESFQEKFGELIREKISPEGICFLAKKNRWIAYSYNPRCHIGTFLTETEAKKALKDFQKTGETCAKQRIKTSKYKYVFALNNKWMARGPFGLNGAKKYLGLFNTPEEAHKAVLSITSQI